MCLALIAVFLAAASLSAPCGGVKPSKPRQPEQELSEITGPASETILDEQEASGSVTNDFFGVQIIEHSERALDVSLSALKEIPLIGKEREMVEDVTTPAMKLKKLRFTGITQY